MKSMWRDSLIVPIYVSVVSAAILILHIPLLSKTIKWLYTCLIPNPNPNSTEPFTPAQDQGDYPASRVQRHIASHGGAAVFAHSVVRLIGCLALLGLSISKIMLEEGPIDKLFSVMARKHLDKEYSTRGYLTSAGCCEAEWLQVASCMTTIYILFLALVSISASPRWSRLFSRHLSIVLLALFATYVYRDIWPLATFTEDPLDIIEGGLLWAKVVILTVVGVIIPLTVPRQYTPVDPKKPAAVPNPEQTTSLIGLLTWCFLDPIVFSAYRISHLRHDKLPPLADYDQAKNLMKISLPKLDLISPRKKRHIFWGLLSIYPTEYITLAFMDVVVALSEIATPIGMYQLLQFLETNGENATVRPWAWIVWLLFAPTIRSIAFQWYTFLATRILVRTEGIITQLIFNHALRIRMKAVLPVDTCSENDRSTVASTSITEAREGPNGSSDENVSQSIPAGIRSTTKSWKGKQKTKDAQHLMDSTPMPKEATADNLVGKINNLVTTDLNNITEAKDFLNLIVYIPLQIGLSIWFLYTVLGWSAFVGLFIMVTLFPIPGYFAARIQSVQIARMKQTDTRVQTVTETMNVLRMIKLFGWENKMNQKIADTRERELKSLQRRQIFDIGNSNIYFLIAITAMLATYTIFALVMKEDMTASKVFTSMSVFDALLQQLHILSSTIPRLVQGKVSLDRVDSFLNDTELIDSFTVKNNQDGIGLLAGNAQLKLDGIGFRNAMFSWSNMNDGNSTRYHFCLRIEDELLFQRGRINLVIGPTGSGKTSLLMALLGEMHFIPTGPSSSFNLPRVNGVAYAAQESWIQNKTIKENILFGSPYDEERYQKVIFQCGLLRDLELLDAGDETEVGEKGLTLSGGQKARIALARAIYCPVEILLLDDVLAALDVHTAKHIVEKCLSGDLVYGRTIILVTHNVEMVSPIAHFVVSLGTNGRVLSQGSVSDPLVQSRLLAAKVQKDENVVEKAVDEINFTEPKRETAKGDGKLTVAEEIQEGHLSAQALSLFFVSLGGSHPLLFWIAFLVPLFCKFFIYTFETWWLGFWASQYDRSSEVAVPYYLKIYALLLVASAVCESLASLIYMSGSLRASRIIHKVLIESVLSTTLRWLDMTPTSRVIARCTQDIRAVDGPINQNFSSVVQLSLSMIMKLVAIIIISPIFVVPGVVVAILGAWCCQTYIKAQLSVKREMSNARSPVLTHFGAAISGLVSIRAYGAQTVLMEESIVHIDHYTRAARTFHNLNRWISVRIDALGAVFTAGLATYLVYGRNVAPEASNTGFSLNMAIGFSSLILWWVRDLNEFEVSGNSLERIQNYIAIEHEPKPDIGGQPPAYWPASGDIKVENLSARYSANGPKVLHDLSFHIKSGERVGVVGRTGSGKSSLTLSLLRGILTEGTIYYDGIPTNTLNLDAIRSNITIIPQVPELLTGTLRQNLDPFDEYDDPTLNDALYAAGIFSLQGEVDEGRVSLDSSISAGGRNLSVGQRQILALARAIVRRSKLLILDEATSAIDYETDAIIQNSVRHKLDRDVTIITVAHRLQTIMDADKIMVLDAGRIVEFDRPSELLKNEKGMFRALVDESSDADRLVAMAVGRA